MYDWSVKCKNKSEFYFPSEACPEVVTPALNEYLPYTQNYLSLQLFIFNITMLSGVN